MDQVANTKTKAFLEQKCGQTLTDVEAAQHKDKLVRFFSLLIEIDQNNKQKSNETKNN